MNKPAVGWPDVDHARTPLGWVRPSNLMPPVAAGWSPGTRRNASEAESILSEAVAWWDPTVSGFRDGDRWLRNSGTAGGLLDLRLGSSTVANTNDPLYLAPDATGYVYLPGVSGNVLSVPDENALDITGDLELIICVAYDNWTPSASCDVISKWGPGLSYGVMLMTTGALRFYWSVNGSTALFAASTATVPANNGQPKWIKITVDVDPGTVRFYHADGVSTLPTAWTQIGADVSMGGVTSIFAGTANLLMGGAALIANPTAKYFRTIVKNGIDGTTVLDVDCDAITTGSATSFTATTGQTVTINRSTSGRKSVAVPARRLGGRACFLFGTDDYMQVVDNWQHQLLNFGQGDSFTVMLALRRFAAAETEFYFTKRPTASTAVGTAGWYIYGSSSLFPIVRLDDGVNLTSRTMNQASSGQLTVLTATRNTSRRLLTGNWITPVVDTGTTDTTTNIVNRTPVRLGTHGSASTTYFLNGEVSAAAIWRRPLTAREQQLVITYYSGG